MKLKIAVVGVVFMVILAGASSCLLFKEKRKAEEAKMEKPLVTEEDTKAYDVIVIGGEPEGVAAAVSAARNGAKTLLVEKREDLGGLFTYGLLNFLDIPQGKDGASVSKGIFEEWHRLVGNDNAFGIEVAKEAFKELVTGESNLTLITETNVVDVVVKDKVVTKIKLKNKDDEYIVTGTTFIDATQDAEFAAMAGVPYFIGGEDIGIENVRMSVTLMIHLKHVNWEEVKKTAASEKFGVAVVTDSVAWGFPETLHAYEPVEENARLRGINLAKVADEYFINALQIFDVDGLDEKSKQAAIEKGKKETEHILRFLQEEFPGFEQAEIASFPEELYVRETRHILAEYQLPMSDVWTNKDHWDGIAYGAYPVDIQAQTPQDYGRVVAAPDKYAIPFRSLVPREVDGLLVVGRSTGFSSLAAGSARVVPTGMATGEAAGLAATMAVKENISFRNMSKNKEMISLLREKLKNQGAYVEHTTLDYPYKDEWFDKAIQRLINYGLVYGGYNNDMLVEEKVTSHRLMQMMKGIFIQADAEVEKEQQDKLLGIYTNLFDKDPYIMDRDKIAHILVRLFLTNEESGLSDWEQLVARGIINKEAANRLKTNEDVLLKELFVLGASVLDYLENKNK